MRIDNACFVSLTALLITLTAAANGAGKYFPERGKGAVAQRSLDVRGSTVVMFVALQPGVEDHPLLSRLRLGSGARTVVVFVTNGDATPSDLNGEAPQFTAARRKEEAYAAVSLLGGQAHFLNLPDPGVVSSDSVLEQIWNRDTVVTRFRRALRSYRPDLVIIGGEYRGENRASVRQRLVSRLVRETVTGTEGTGSEAPAPWNVSRIVEEDPLRSSGRNRNYDEIHPVWKKSYRAIGSEAAHTYATLQFTRKRWDARGDRAYRQLFPASAPVRGSLVEGLPEISKRLENLGRIVRGAVKRQAPTLNGVAATLDSVERVIATQGDALTQPELRLIAGWKNILEDLRCTLLDVAVSIAPTDSVVTQAQLLNLNIREVASRSAPGNLRVLFPGARDRKWGINESAEYNFALTPPQEFRVLTPVAQEYNAPVSQFGMLRSLPRTRFPFLIYHVDSISARNFVYRGELALQVAPKRTFEILTPAIRAQHGEPVLYRLMNVSRDGYRGSIGFADSLALPGEKPIILKDRDQVVVDTLFFEPTREDLPESFAVKVQLSGEGISTRVLAKRFEALTDPSARVGLVTPFADGVAGLALRRLRIPYRSLNTSGAPPDRLEDLNTIVVDREALAGMTDLKRWRSALEGWMREGGHLIILPQVEFPSTLLVPDGPRLPPGDPTEPSERITTAGDHPFLTTPNRIGEDDWRGWVVSRSLSGIELSWTAGAESIVWSAATGTTYLATAKIGKGRATLVALDLISQLTNIHPGAHRLFANLIRPAY